MSQSSAELLCAIANVYYLSATQKKKKIKSIEKSPTFLVAFKMTYLTERFGWGEGKKKQQVSLGLTMG